MKPALPIGLLLTALAQGLAVVSQVSPLGTGRLVDGDCYMRLARVEALLAGQGWYDATTLLTNPPLGEALHWTRLFDLPIAIMAAPLLPFLDIQESVWQAGLWIGPLLALAAVSLLLWGLSPHLKTGGLVLAAALFAFQPSILGVFMPARPDHHGLQILLEIAVLAGLMRPGLKPALLAGLAGALALWVSAEALLLILAAGLALGPAWVMGGDPERKRLVAFTLTLAVGTTVALGVERPPADWLALEYDRLSIVQVGLCWILALSVGWLAIGNAWAVTWQRRLLLCLGMAAQAAGLMALLFPDFFAGPYGKLDPRLVPIWFSLVKEAQPLGFGAKFVLLLTPPALALGYCLWRLIRGAHDQERRLLLASGLAIMVYVPATLYQSRIGAFAQAADIAPWTLLALAALRLGRMKVVAVPLVLVGNLLLAALVGKLEIGIRDPGAPDICSWERLASHLKDTWPDDKRPILTYIFPGPELAYLSGHAVVAGPYHRSTEGILDIANAFGGESDAPAHGVVSKRGIGWVVVCDKESEAFGFNDRGGVDGFHAKLLRGNTPVWLKQAGAIRSSIGNFMLYEVIP